MTFIPSSRPLNHPFLFKSYPDLVGELMLDDVFRSRPGSVEEEATIGILYPNLYSKESPLGTLEPVLSKYKGLSDRYVFFTVGYGEKSAVVHAVIEGGGVKRPIEKEGVYDYFFDQIIAQLVHLGFSKTEVVKNLHPSNGDIAAWVIGYERITGNTTILDCSENCEMIRAFLRGEKNITPLKMPSTERK